MDISQLVHPLTYWWHLGCFHSFALLQIKLLWTFAYRILGKYKFSFLTREDWLDSRLVCIYHKRHYFPKWLYHFKFLLALSETSSTSISLSIIDTVRLLKFRLFNMCAMVLTCISLIANNVKHLYMYLFTCFIYSWWSISSNCPFLKITVYFIIKFSVFFLYSGSKVFIRCMTSK